MIYPAKTYNFLTRRLSRAMLTLIWLTIGLAIFSLVVSIIGGIAAINSGDEDTILAFMSFTFIVSGIVSILEIIFFIIYFVRLYDFRNNVEGKDRSNSSLLITAIWIQIATPILATLLMVIAITSSNFSFAGINDTDDLVDALEWFLEDVGPMFAIAGIVSLLGSLVAFVLQLIGYAGLGKSQTLYRYTADGFKSVFMSYIWLIIGFGAYILMMILGYATELPAFIAIGGLAFFVICIVSLVKLIKGWNLVGVPAPVEADPVPIS